MVGGRWSVVGGRWSVVVHLRLKQWLGSVDIAARLGVASSTVHAVLIRCHLQRVPTSTGVESMDMVDGFLDEQRVVGTEEAVTA